MKVKTNIRAGKQTQNRNSSGGVESVYVVVPPVSRCVGI
jgi:hypothetical protein